jgi:hypothetical protein
MRGRGLKRYRFAFCLGLRQSRPPCGAWIETKGSVNYETTEESPPMRGRGLKHVLDMGGTMAKGVAPHAGAWIETQ